MTPFLVRTARAGSLRLTVAGLVAVAIVAPDRLGAQLISPRTVPVFQGNQFGILPSVAAGMGGVSLALDDTLSDAFAVPSKAARLREGILFASPFRHSISGDRGGGRTFPIGGTAAFGPWSVAGVYATQEIQRAGPMRFSQANSDRTSGNQYLALSVARRLPEGVSLGVSGSFAALGAVDGVDLLYGGSDNIRQLGSSSDIRLGMTREFAPRRTLDLVLVHNRYEMTHDVHFFNTIWVPVQQRTVTTERTEHNDDRTHIWGAHAEYTQPLRAPGWSIGWLATANRLTHPKIPNYVLQNIPRDPGSSVAFNAGIGLSKQWGGSTFGIDFVVEPIRSNTWADAATDTAIVGGGTIKAGGKTVENDFRFANSLIRAGFGHEFVLDADSSGFVGITLGLAAYAINYTLDQQNNVQKTFRTQREGWTEWTPTFGLSYRSKSVSLNYGWTSTCATDCVTIGDDVRIMTPSVFDLASGPAVVAAPSSPLTFSGGSASSHKVWIAVPIR